MSRHNHAVFLQITALFVMVGFGSVFAILGDLRRLLMALRPAPSPAAVEAVVYRVLSQGMPAPDLPSGFTGGPAYRAEEEAAAAWRAIYAVAATDRLSNPTDFDLAVERELQNYTLHTEAEERRLRAAALVDAAAQLMSDRTTDNLLGWRAVVDDRTTPECRAAHGCNFRADRMPLIGWPGAVHMRCRCSAGPPIPGAPLLPSV